MFKTSLLSGQDSRIFLLIGKKTINLCQTELLNIRLWLFFILSVIPFRKRNLHCFLFKQVMIVAFSCLIIFPTTVARSDPITVRVGVKKHDAKILPNNRSIITKISIGILKYIAEEESWELEFVYGNQTQSMERLEKNEIDVMVDVAFSEEKCQKYDFTNESVLLDWGEVFTRNKNPIETVSDFQWKKVAVVRGSSHCDGENGIKSLTDRFGIECSFIETDNYQKVFELINSKKVDIGIVGKLFGHIYENYNNIVKTKFILDPVKLKFAFPKNTPNIQKLKNRIDYHLANLKKDTDSVYYTIINSNTDNLTAKPISEQTPKGIALTTEEKEWLENHKNIRIGVDHAYAPYSFVDNNGNYYGVAMDFVDIINKKLNINMEVVPMESWSHIIEGIPNNSLDVIVTAAKTTERESFLGFTKIYIPTPLVIMVRDEDDSVYGPEDLAGKRVALVKGYSSSERVVKEHPDIKGLYVDTPLDGLTAVSVNEADLYVGVLGINSYLARRHGIANLKVASRFDMISNGQRFAVRKEWPQFVSILNKALDSIHERDKIAIFNKWVPIRQADQGALTFKKELTLTEEEVAWIRAHQDIRLGVDPEFAPFEYFSKEGIYSGVASEYVKILNVRLGLKMQVISGLSWDDVVEKAKVKEIDVLPSVGITKNRKSYLNYSKPYVNFHRVIITRIDTPFLSSLDDIKDLDVAVQANSSHEGYLKDHTDIKPVLYKTLQEALIATSEGNADAIVGNIASVTYWIRKLNLTNLKVAAPVSMTLQSLHFAVRKDWPELVNIINKGLSSISLAKEDKIRRRWIKVEYNPGIDPGTVWRYVWRISAVSLFVFMVILVWNQRLKKEVRRRKKIEKDLQYRLNFEDLILKISSRFIKLKMTEIDYQINQALKEICLFVSLDTGYIYRLSNRGNSFFNTHFWRKNNLQDGGKISSNMDVSSLPWWRNCLKDGKIVSFSQIDELPISASKAKEILFSQGVTSRIDVPMSYGDKIIGFLGMSSMQKSQNWTPDKIIILQLVGQVFSNALEQKKTLEELQCAHEKLEQRVEERTADLANANLNLKQGIIERKRMEKEKAILVNQLHQSQKMEAIGTLAGGIAHDFNNILTPIIGYSELMLSNLQAKSVESSNLKKILGAGHRAKDLVKQILTFSRHSETEKKPIHLNSIVKDTIKLLMASFPANIKIRDCLEPDCGCVMADPTQIHQIVMNLCTNAYHAMRENGGILTISLSKINVDHNNCGSDCPRKPGEYLRLKVSDTGHGIEQTLQKRIFDPYFTTKQANEGTGLGLSVVHGIVKNHNGYITVDSELAKGTTFCVFLPKFVTQSIINEPEYKRKIAGGNENISLVDNEEPIAQMEKTILENLGYRVNAFTSSIAILRKLENDPGDCSLIITDMDMPNMTGLELAQEIHSLCPDIPIILLSGFSEIIDKDEMKKFGIKRYIMKPVKGYELAMVVREVLDKKSEILA